MPDALVRNSPKAWLPPGTLVHVGRRRTQTTTWQVISYDAQGLATLDGPAPGDLPALAQRPGVTWIRVTGLHQVETIAALGEAMGLHPLAQEDIVNTAQRPKLEDYGDYLFLVVKALIQDPAEDGCPPQQISLVLGQGWVMTFEEGPSRLFEPLLARLQGAKGRARSQGADYLSYALLDAVVDSYFELLEVLGDQVEDLEEELLAQPGSQALQTLHRLRRQALLLRKAAWPLREVISALERHDGGLVRPATRIYLRDVYDHTVQIMDAVDSNRDMLSGMLDLYLSSISNRMNEVMKVLTIISTLFIPLTFLAGLYGMNFEYMPELKWHWGYPAVLLAMAICVLGMLVFFRRKKWF